MKNLIAYLFLLNLISCSKLSGTKNDLELEILNDTLVAFPYDLKKDTINVLNYSIENKSDQIYYFKQGLEANFLSKKIYKNGIYVRIYDLDNKEVDYSYKMYYEHQKRSDCFSECNFMQATKLVINAERLKEHITGGYYEAKDLRHYFFIHPNEKLFFKQYINLTDSLRYEDNRVYYAHLKKNLKYSSKFFIPSDSTNFKKELPNDVLETIKANNAKVYHGIIESKNKVPIKVLE